VDFPDCIDWINGLGFPSKFVIDSIAGFDFLLVYDGRIERMELDLFHLLVAGWFGDLLRV
jgi:hypothetical protein